MSLVLIFVLYFSLDSVLALFGDWIQKNPLHIFTYDVYLKAKGIFSTGKL